MFETSIWQKKTPTILLSKDTKTIAQIIYTCVKTCYTETAAGEQSQLYRLVDMLCDLENTLEKATKVGKFVIV